MMVTDPYQSRGGVRSEQRQREAEWWEKQLGKPVHSAERSSR